MDLLTDNLALVLCAVLIVGCFYVLNFSGKTHKFIESPKQSPSPNVYSSLLPHDLELIEQEMEQSLFYLNKIETL